MTTITTGTSGPQAWKIALVAGAVGLATLVVVNLPQTSDTTGQQATEQSQAVTAESPQARSFFDENSATGRTPALPESVTGFEYDNESTSGQIASPGVTTQYTGNSGELMPFENGPAPAQAPTGFSGPMPQATLNQAEISRLAPVITQEFLDGPSSGSQGATRVDPGAAAAAGLSPGAIDAIVGGTTQVAPQPDSLADAQARAQATQAVPAPALAASDEALVRGVNETTFNSAPYVAYAEGMSDAANGGANTQAWQAYVDAVNSGSVAALYEANASEPVGVADAATNARWEALAEAYRTGSTSISSTGDPDPVVGIPANANATAATNARWGALHEAHHNGTLSGYTTRSAVTDPVDKKYLEAQPAVAPQTEPHVPMENNQAL